MSRFLIVSILALLMVSNVLQPVAAATGTLDQQQTSILGGLLLYSSPPAASYQFLSQTFTAGLTGALTEVELAIGYEGDSTPTGSVTVEIHSGSPTGTLLGSSSLGPSGIPEFVGSAPDVFVAFTFSGVSVVAGNVYAIVITASNAQYDPPHYVVADYYLSDSYAAGTAYYNDGSGWIDLTYDIAFKTYVAEPYCDIEQNGSPIQNLNVQVSSTFTVDVWIRDIPAGWGLTQFNIQVNFDPNDVEFIDSEFLDPNVGGWIGGGNVIEPGRWNGDAQSGGLSDVWTEDRAWFVLTFHCLRAGPTPITVTSPPVGTIILVPVGGGSPVFLEPEPVTVIVNQFEPAPVAGVVVQKNSLEIVTPYLALAGLIVAISTVFVIKKLKN